MPEGEEHAPELSRPKRVSETSESQNCRQGEIERTPLRPGDLGGELIQAGYIIELMR